jgi:hypothetical protein
LVIALKGSLVAEQKTQQARKPPGFLWRVEQRVVFVMRRYEMP